MTSSQPGQPSSEVYFLGFRGYSFPLVPTGAVSKEEALEQAAYCRAEYDANGRLSVFEKFLDGVLFFRHEYRYHANGVLREVRHTRPDRPDSIERFHESGARLDVRDAASMGLARAALARAQGVECGDWRRTGR